MRFLKNSLRFLRKFFEISWSFLKIAHHFSGFHSISRRFQVLRFWDSEIPQDLFQTFLRFLDASQDFSEFLKIYRLRDFSRILWDFSENSSRFPEDFSKFLRISSNFLGCFKISQDFSRSLIISQGFAKFFKFSRDFF